jgi:hypothetical protein
VLLGPLASLALLVVVAGAAKLQAPGPTSAALIALGAPDARAAVLARSLGALEVAVGLWALLLGGTAPALALAALHLGFAGVTASLRRRPTVPCGCFGAQDAPATTTGLVVNLASAGVAVAAAVWPVPSVVTALADEPVTVAATLVVAAVGAWLLHELHGGSPGAAAAT